MPAAPFDEADRIRLTRAFGFAAAWHRVDARNGDRGVVALGERLRVAGLVLELGGSAEQAVAALVTDGPATAADPDERAHREDTIRALLGERVLALVQTAIGARDVVRADGVLARTLADERLLAAVRGGEIGSDAALLVACCAHERLDALVRALRAGVGVGAARTTAPLGAQLASQRALASALAAVLGDARIAIWIRALADEASRLVGPR